ncbi:Cation/H+ exchanger [Macleaya cordata]|uniref:Cation/H+ exchanger n=1 Tax=Macleaya cordata TaxID=56857 RepID=A0A200QQJ0_MACCD|nr:Cation/H+ exchanger [Macleaya cordata]
MVKKSGKKAWFIGLSCFFLPMALSLSVSFLVKTYIKVDQPIASSLYAAGALTSLSSFHDIACFLEDLKLLNSELGRLSMSASMISGSCSIASAFLAFTITQTNKLADKSKPDTHKISTGIILACCAMLLCIVFLVRPIMFWMIRQTPEDKNVKEEYIFLIFVMVMVSSLVGEYGGQHYLVGPLMLGLAVPVGPPLGAAIEDKLEFFITGLLLPLVAVSRATRIDIFTIGFHNFVTVMFVAMFSIIGKLMGTILPALFCRMPYQDALLLGLIMNVQGVLDIQFWLRALSLKLINGKVYGSLMLLMVIVTGTISPIVKVLYDPSRRYLTYKRRTIQHSKSNAELRILACIYHDENVPTIINLLEASHPTRDSPICVYALHLIQLQGRASPLLIAHKRSHEKYSPFNQSTRIINAFSFYEQDNHGLVAVNSFTAISPYTTMHNDICTLGLEKRISLIIIPFHHQPTVLSALHSSPGIRKVNHNVLNNAPCSVGILIDRRSTKAAPSAFISGNRSSYHVAVIFLGGADDREALAYGARMGEDTNVNLTVFRFIDRNERVDKLSEKQMDYDAINEFRMHAIDNENVEYTEEEVSDGVEFVAVIRSIESSFELLIVGRQHGEESSHLLHGFEEWNEYPELGIVGDMLVSCDTKSEGSVLVVQQQPRISSHSLENSKYRYGQVQ